MLRDCHRILGTMVAELRTLDGSVVSVTRARNTVVQSGGQLLADLFCGKTTLPINGLAVGLSSDPMAPPYKLTELTTKDAAGTTMLLNSVVGIPKEAFEVTALEDDFAVVVSVRTVLPANMARSADPNSNIVPVSEAALGILSADGLSLERIYNRVVFDPIPKEQDKHEISFYWEIRFPYGA